MSQIERSKRDYQYDISEKYIIRKQKVSKSYELSDKRDNFSCPHGNIGYGEYYDPEDRDWYSKEMEFGIQKHENKTSWRFGKACGNCTEFYGEEI